MKYFQYLFWGLVVSILTLFFGTIYADAAPVNPNTILGCQYNLTPPVLTDGKVIALQCDVNGNLILSNTFNNPPYIFNGTTATVGPNSGVVQIGTANAGGLSVGGTIYNSPRNTTTSGPAYGIVSQGIQAANSTGQNFGIVAANTYALSGALTELTGLDTTPQNTGTGTITSLNGLYSGPANTGAGTVTSLQGVFTRPEQDGSGTLPLVYGMIAQPTLNNAAGTLTQGIGYYNDCRNLIAGGTFTQCVGLYLDYEPAQTFGLEISISQQNPGAYNIFKGSIMLGTGALVLGGDKQIDLQGNAITIEVTNGAAGNTLHTLAKYSADSTVIKTTVTDITKAVGIIVGNAQTSGTAQMCVQGICQCVFENATTFGDYVTVGTTTAGNCHDNGSVIPAFATAGLVGIVQKSGSAGSTQPVQMMLIP